MKNFLHPTKFHLMGGFLGYRLPTKPTNDECQMEDDGAICHANSSTDLRTNGKWN